MRKKVNLAGVLAVGGVITYLSFISGSGGATGTTGTHSPLLHATAYFGLAAALMIYFHDTDYGHFEAFLAAFLYGFIIEIVQGTTPYRFFAWIDVAANGAGAFLVMLDSRTDFYRYIIQLENYFLGILASKIPTDF